MNDNLNLINSLNPSTDRIVLLPKNPNTFFVFWQFSEARTKLFMSGSYKDEIILKLFNSDDRTCLTELKFSKDTFKAYVPCPCNTRLPATNSSGSSDSRVTSIYAVVYAQTTSGCIETLAESNVIAICPHVTSGTQNFLTDNSEYYRAVIK